MPKLTCAEEDRAYGMDLDDLESLARQQLAEQHQDSDPCPSGRPTENGGLLDRFDGVIRDDRMRRPASLDADVRGAEGGKEVEAPNARFFSSAFPRKK